MSPGRSRSGGRESLTTARRYVEVGAEGAAVDLGAEVAVGGGDDAQVAADGGGRADAADLAGLEGAQELGLELGRQLADLVEEEGAAGGLLECADPALGGAGEGARLVAEQLGLDEVRRDRAAVDDDERAVGARARVVDGGGGAFLAGAGLALDEDGGVARGDLLELREHLAHGGAVADQGAERGAVGVDDLGALGVDVDANVGVAEGEDGAAADGGVGERDAAHEGAVAAAEVAHADAVTGDGELTVEARDRGIVDHEVVASVGSDGAALSGAVPARARGWARGHGDAKPADRAALRAGGPRRDDRGYDRRGRPDHRQVTTSLPGATTALVAPASQPASAAGFAGTGSM